MRFAKLLMTLAAVCLLAAPAFSMPWGAGGMGPRACAAFGNLTQEEMNNMTLAELKSLQQENARAPDGRPMFAGGACMLLASDITKETLEGMTLAEIKAKWQELNDRMNNMTMAEIQNLGEQKKTEIESMTLAQIQEQREVCRILEMVGHMDEKGMGMGMRGPHQDMGMPGQCMKGMGQQCMGIPGQCMQGDGNDQAGRNCPRGGQ
ncbi:MAG: hypothetical protein A4E45_00638 [Methanosaeta sp. PtaB.Bin039]|nr:MAG: hypothetical protein A4E45_00638 [Methanosaeta sp. PtaB.Bin039]OPY47368.1 MAG: hypothetical protein A4E47_00318 [Methanosaeta sp. PtaU1.Bin028]